MNIFDPVPSFESIERTQAVFQESTVTYNQAGLTYNDISSVYGGSDSKQSPGPSMDMITNSIPQG